MTKARHSLSKRIRELQACQQVYIPGIANLLDVNQEDERLEDQPEVLKLRLPSQLSGDDRSAWCLPGISHLEFRFRYAQASDALAELRRLRRLFQGTRDHNAKHTKSTSATTRSQGILDRFHSRIKHVANRYHSARQALLALDPREGLAVGWKGCFLELKEGDICGPDREADKTSEGKFQQSWIWTVSHPPSLISSNPSPSAADATPPHQQPPSSASTVVSAEGLGGSAPDEQEENHSRRAHWARTQARAEWYEEEVKLTVEEMGRTLQYFRWKKSWWESLSSERGQSNNPPPLNIQAGLHAYAHRQSDIYGKLITLFVNRWHGFLSAHSLGLSWLCNYPLDAHPAPPMRPCRGHRKSDTGFSITDTPRRPIASSKAANSNPKSSSHLSTPASTLDDGVDTPLDDSVDAPLDDNIDAPLESGSDEDSDFEPDDSSDEDSADDD